jgi:DNA-binding NarL/FixJ family response regulator
MTGSTEIAKARVFIIDDHYLLRRSLKLFLEREYCQVVGEASDATDTIKAVGRLQPDVILIDIEIRDVDGLKTARRIAKLVPAAKIIILSAHNGEEYVIEAFRTFGVYGYVVKSDAAVELVLAIRATINGRRYISRSVSAGERLVSKVLGRRGLNQLEKPKGLKRR